MATLLFEIWEDRGEGCVGVEMSSVSREHDNFRNSFSPNAVLIHTFRASSYFEAARIHHAFMGWEAWKPEPDWVEDHYTDDEAREQEAYLLVRDSKHGLETA
jgi:hypothetical protein